MAGNENIREIVFAIHKRTRRRADSQQADKNQKAAYPEMGGTRKTKLPQKEVEHA